MGQLLRIGWRIAGFACAAGLAALGAGGAAAESATIATTANTIHCHIGDDIGKGSLLCVIFEREGPLARPRPADCAQGWGHAYYIEDHGPVQMVCYQVSKTDWRGNFQFDVTQTARFGGVSCRATRRVVDCRNLDGNGFFLSRREQTIF
ncbi:hypothetical protein IV417_00715 [Alphaproteobacteria bacterium KMM 3653]|uniref:Uncharacterized protein n=1 Tax=Harenicola maris TaxID=2841044 RepID=A0AAP2CMN3_9RHOB|nr:hypothetical protein [Harenicola maris]